MALKIVDGNEIRVPGRAMPEGKRRQGALGKIDALSYSEFRKLHFSERLELMAEAREQKADEGNDPQAQRRLYERSMSAYKELSGYCSGKMEYPYRNDLSEMVLDAYAKSYTADAARVYGKLAALEGKQVCIMPEEAMSFIDGVGPAHKV